MFQLNIRSRKIEKINRLISESIDKIDRDFQNTVLLATVFDKPMTETIGYQVTHNTSEALSIVVNIKQDMNGAHPASMTQFWTFDKKVWRSCRLS